MDAQMKKGVLEMCILFAISNEEMYGYDIMKMMSQYFPEVNESTFYAILRRLHKEGTTETYFGETSNGPTRKYYRITEIGEAYLSSSVKDWINLNKIINSIGINLKDKNK